jgi:hypothetical protein
MAEVRPVGWSARRTEQRASCAVSDEVSGVGDRGLVRLDSHAPRIADGGVRLAPPIRMVTGEVIRWGWFGVIRAPCRVTTTRTGRVE